MPRLDASMGWLAAGSMLLASCGGSGADPHPADVVDLTPQSSSTPVDEAPRCGLTLYTSDYPTKCESDLDGRCCDAEKACGADPACAKLVTCMNACPSPRTDACIGACAGSGPEPPPGYEKLDAIAECSKKAHTGSGCSWPSGEGH